MEADSAPPQEMGEPAPMESMEMSDSGPIDPVPVKSMEGASASENVQATPEPFGDQAMSAEDGSGAQEEPMQAEAEHAKENGNGSSGGDHHEDAENKDDGNAQDDFEEEKPAPAEEKKMDDPFSKMLSGYEDSSDSKNDEEKVAADTDEKDADDADAKEDSDAPKDTFDKMLSASGGDDKPIDTEDKGEESDKKEDDNDEDQSNKIATTIVADLLDEAVATPPPQEDEIVAITSEKVASDDKYYEDLKPEELEFLQTNMPSVDSVLAKLNCSVCSKNLDPVYGTNKGVQRHPHLGVPLCSSCRKFYGDGDWPRTEDGDEYCRMCAQGGDILLCDKCPNAFCKKCISRNLGARSLREITKSEEWSCLLCDPTPLYAIKAIYYCVYKNQTEIKERREQERQKAILKRAERKDKLAKEREALVKSPKNFLEENISEAFKTLEVYQKSLEAERERCIKTVKEGITVEIATSITRKLRKLYAVTQKNMDLLDRAIVESYVENFPTESTRIHMGRMAPVEPPPPKKKKLTAKQKLKLKQKKAKAKGKPGRKKGVIQMNGAPVYAEVNYGGKKRKKAAREVELIDVSEDDEYYAPKKKSRPGPASSKKKAGPKSKTYY